MLYFMTLNSQLPLNGPQAQGFSTLKKLSGQHVSDIKLSMMVIVFILFLFSCAYSPTQTTLGDDGIPLKVAVIENISSRTAKAVLPSAVSKNKQYVTKVGWDRIVNTGELSSVNFRNVFIGLFTVCDFYESKEFDKEKYDLIIEIRMSEQLKGLECYPDCRRRGATTHAASVEYTLDLYNFQGKHIETISATGNHARGISALGIWSHNSALTGCFETAMEEATRRIILRLQDSIKVKEQIELVNMKKSLPAKLITKVRYSDESCLIPNNSIDSAEESRIDIIVKNNGKGSAFDVSVNTESECNHIQFPKTIEIGDIRPGESKEVTIPIKADRSLATGTARFVIKAHEKRGYDARPVELQIPTAGLRSPKLVLASCNINDASGLAKGDGDGRAENNETIELNPYVENRGAGEGLKVQVVLKDVTEGIEVIKGSDEMPLIGPGTVGRATLAFRVPRTFQGSEIKYTISATDVRGMKTEETYSVPFRSKTPVLHYTYQIVDGRNREVPGLENGKSYKLKITPKNTGENIAAGVRLRVTPESARITVDNYNGDVGQLQPDSAGSAINVPISLGRSFVDQSLSLDVSMEQDGFPGFSKRITLPVMVKKPVLEYNVALLNGVSERAVSQNSSPRFRVSINNNGNLDANNVKVMFSVSSGELDFKKEETIGSIKAGKSQYRDFTFFIRGDARVGEFPVTLGITQADFDGLRADTTWDVVEQTAIVQRVKATGTAQTKLGSRYSGPPEIFMNSPIKNTRTYNQTIDFHGSVMTFGPGNAAERLSIRLNDRPLTIIPVTEEIRLDPNQITKRVVGGNKIIFDGLVVLKPGANEIRVECADRNGQRSEQRIKITKVAKLGNIYAVVVGISKFGNADYNLRYAASDAGKFCDFLRSESGGQLSQKRLKLLSDFSATRANVIGTLTGLLGRATKEDTVVIYLATHGVTDADGTLYYLCYDTDMENLRGTGFSDKDLTDILSKNIRAGKTIIYLDACHSGLSGLSERYDKRGIGVYEVNEKINSLAAALSKVGQTGVVTFSASSSVGSSLEDPKWQGGVFTYSLIKGLKGEANENKDEWVSINELDNYLVRKVMALTGGKQRPKVNGTLMGDTPLSKVR